MSIALARGPLEGGKIQGHHRDRLAVVYVRQSTVQQLSRHQESTRLQYGLVERAQQLGWSAHRVLVIDEDLGKFGHAVGAGDLWSVWITDGDPLQQQRPGFTVCLQPYGG